MTRPAGKEDGANGYAWTFSTPTERYFPAWPPQGMVDEVLERVQTVGCWSATIYAAYHHYPGLKQRCWVQLLRDIHDLKILYPKDRQLARWAAAVDHIYSAAKSFAHPQARQRQRVQQQLERKLQQPSASPSLRPRPGSRPRQPVPAYREAHQGTVCLRGCPRRALGQQPAERSLRPLVVSRKISGGTRSEQGTDTKMTLASLFGTWRRPGPRSSVECHKLLTSPQV